MLLCVDYAHPRFLRTANGIWLLAILALFPIPYLPQLWGRAGDSSSSRIPWLTASGYGRPRAMVSPSCGWMRSKIPCPRHYVQLLLGHNTSRLLKNSY